jgi:hypothetical protein
MTFAAPWWAADEVALVDSSWREPTGQVVGDIAAPECRPVVAISAATTGERLKTDAAEVARSALRPAT